MKAFYTDDRLTDSFLRPPKQEVAFLGSLEAPVCLHGCEAENKLEIVINGVEDSCFVRRSANWRILSYGVKSAEFG